MEGKLVRLRAYEKSDLDAVMKWINDEEVTDLLGGEMLAYPVSSIAEAKFIEAGRQLHPISRRTSRSRRSLSADISARFRST